MCMYIFWEFILVMIPKRKESCAQGRKRWKTEQEQLPNLAGSLDKFTVNIADIYHYIMTAMCWKCIFYFTVTPAVTILQWGVFQIFNNLHFNTFMHIYMNTYIHNNIWLCCLSSILYSIDTFLTGIYYYTFSTLYTPSCFLYLVSYTSLTICTYVILFYINTETRLTYVLQPAFSYKLY